MVITPQRMAFVGRLHGVLETDLGDCGGASEEVPRDHHYLDCGGGKLLGKRFQKSVLRDWAILQAGLPPTIWVAVFEGRWLPAPPSPPKREIIKSKRRETRCTKK